MMWPYYVLVGAPALLAVLGNYLGNKKIQNRLVIVSFFLIWLFLLFFRSERIGTDTITYHQMFIDASRMSYGKIFSLIGKEDSDVAFYLISKTVSIFTMNFRVVMVIIALISIVPVALMYFFEAEDNAYLSVVVFLSLGLFSIYFSAFRQVMAMAVAVPAYYLVKKRKLLFFILVIVFSYFIHHSAIIMLLMYPIYHMNLRINSNLVILIPVVGLVYLFRVPIFSWLKRFLGDFQTSTIKETGAVLVFLMLLGFLLFCFVIPDNSELDEDTIGLRNLLFLATILQIFAGINSMAMRMNYYFLIFIPVLIPRIIKYASEKNKFAAQISGIVMVGFFTIWFISRMYTSADILHIYPYIPAWAI